jgi:hypothetical protein
MSAQFQQCDSVAAEIAAGFYASTPASSYAQFVDDDAIRWIETHFYIPELHGPLVLGDYQKKVLREALSEDGEGLFNYSTIVWSDIKKSIKSTIAAAVVLYRAWQSEWGQHYVIANDLKQADSRVGYYIRRAVELHPEMRSLVKIKNYKLELPNHTTIECIPIDPTGEAGSNADTIVFSELWGAKGKAAETMWTEMTLSPMKFGKSLRWIESYAGFKDTSKLLWNLYEQGVTSGERIDDDLEMYANKRARILALWNTEPRLTWQTKAYYDQERATLAATPEEFERVHRNHWSEGGTVRFLDSILWWDACQEELTPPDKHTPLVLALDGAYAAKGDVFGGVAASRHPVKADAVAIRAVMAWEAKGEPRDFEQIQDDIKNFCLAWNVLQIAYDPTQLVQMMQHLSKPSKTKDGQDFPGVLTVEFGQQSDRTASDKQLLDLIVARLIAHDGDTRLREHLNNADKKTVDGKKLRIVKRAETLKIDLAVCASMASARVLELPTVPAVAPAQMTRQSPWRNV